MGENIANQRRRILDVIGPSGRVTNLANVQYNTDKADIYATNFIGNFDGTFAVDGVDRGVIFKDGATINAAPNFFYTSAGDVRIDSNLTVVGNFTVIGSNNAVLTDPIFEIASNVEYGYDTGYMIQRPSGNVLIGHLASEDYDNVLVMSYTDSSAYDTIITPDTSKHLKVEVIGNVTANYYSGNASQLISLTGAAAGTYGLTNSPQSIDFPIITVNSDGRITEIVSNTFTVPPPPDLETVVNVGNSTSNTVLFQNADVAFITTANVGIANSAPEHTLSIGSNIYFDDTGSNTLVTTANISAPYITSNGKYLTDTTDASPGVNGEVIDDQTARIPIISVGLDGRINAISNTLFTVVETSNLDDVVNRGNATANTVLFQNPTTSFVTSSNVGIANAAPGHLLSVGANLYIENSGNLVTTNNVNANYYYGNASKLVSLTSASEGTYGGNSNTTHMNVATITVDSNGYITSISNTTILTETSNLEQVVNRGNTTSNVVIFEAGLLSEGNLVVSSNLSVGANLIVVDSGSNVLTVVGNVHADRYSGNAAQMVSLTGASEGTYGGNSNATHINVASISVDSNGYITLISNTTVLTETSNLDQVVNRGNVTANTVQFTNPITAFTTDLTSNVEMKLGQLANVTISNPIEYQVLQFDGDGWINDYADLTSIKAISNVAGLLKGDAVYVSDATGDTPKIDKADASDPTKMPAIGLVMEDNIDEGDPCHVISFGYFHSSQDSDFQPGEILYVSNTVPGELSNIKPLGIGLDGIQNVGICIKGGQNIKLLVTGVGRTNDIPNANIVTDTSLVDYVYFNNSGNNLLKIDPTLLETKTPNLEQVVNRGNVTSNIVQFTNATTSFVTSSNVGIGNTNPQHLLSLGEGEIFFNSNVVILGAESVISIGTVQANQEPGAIAIGDEAGETLQESNTVAIGVRAGRNNQGTKGVAIGDRAGESDQTENGISIGEKAGQSTQGSAAIAIGQQAGQSGQNNNAISIGRLAGQDRQGDYAIAIGDQAGSILQGSNSIAIGRSAARDPTQVLANTIVLNASGGDLNPIAIDSVYIKNFRNSTTQYTNVLSSNLTSGEVITSSIVVSGSNVGLGGNTSPEHELSVEGNTYSNIITQIIRFDDGVEDSVIQGLTLLDVTQNGNNTVETLRFNNATTSFVTASNVGIGTTSPSQKLDVRGGNMLINWSSGAIIADGVTYYAATVPFSVISNPTSGVLTLGLQNSTTTGTPASLGFFREDDVGNSKLVAGIYSVDGVDTANALDGGLDLRIAKTGNSGGYDTLYTAMRISSNGHVGIGTTTPYASLEVAMNATDFQPTIKIGTATTYTDGMLYLIRLGGNTQQGIGLYKLERGVFGKKGTSIHFQDTEEFSIKTSGWVNLFGLDSTKAYIKNNLGIGTTSPEKVLDVNGDAQIRYNNGGNFGTVSLRLNHNAVDQGSGGGLLLQSGGSLFNSPEAVINTWTSGVSGVAPLLFKIDNVEKMRLTTSGNVGIGTTSPGTNLHVEGLTRTANAVTGNVPTLSIDNSFDLSYGPSRAFRWNLRRDDGENDTGWGGDLILSDWNATKQLDHILHIKNYDDATPGAVGIGTSSPYAKLHVNGTGGTLNGVTARYFNYETVLSYSTSANFGPVSIFASEDIVAGGWIGATSGTMTASDSRIKENIQDINDTVALDQLRLLKPKTYQYKDTIKRGTESVIGFIAQEVKEVIPTAVTIRTQNIPNIYELVNVYQSNVITFANFNTSNLNATSNIINIKTVTGGDERVTLTNVIDEHTIQVVEDLSKFTGSLDENGNVITETITTTYTQEEYDALESKDGINITYTPEITKEEYDILTDEEKEAYTLSYSKTETVNVGDHIFVYGQEVNDFNFLRKETIFTIATAALQEVDRQQQADKERIATLEGQVAALLTRIEALENNNP